MNPEEAVDAFRAPRRPRDGPDPLGTFKLTDEAMDEPPIRARAAWEAADWRPSDTASWRTARL